MKQFLKGILTTAAMLLGYFSQAAAQNTLHATSLQWELAYDSDQLKISTSPYPDSDIKAFKAVMHVDVPVADLLAVLSDPGSGAKWLDGCIRSETISAPSFDFRYGYAVNDLPWPFKNRDVVVSIKTRNNGLNDISISMSSTDAIAPISPNENSLRVPKSTSLYTIKALADGQTEFVWMQHVEPGGQLPDWLINSRIIDLPKVSTPDFIALAREPRYKNARLITDNTGHIIDVELNNGERLSALYNPITTIESNTQ